MSIETKEVNSSQVSSGENTGVPDTDIVSLDGESDTDIVVVGVGTAEILLVPKAQVQQTRAALSGEAAGYANSDVIEALRVNVTVEPAKLTLMYVAEQSNVE